jgi:hypothetical protein
MGLRFEWLFNGPISVYNDTMNILELKWDKSELTSPDAR